MHQTRTRHPGTESEKRGDEERAKRKGAREQFGLRQFPPRSERRGGRHAESKAGEMAAATQLRIR
jgi:hypothetical protein